MRTAIQFTRWLMGQTRLIYAEMGIADNPQTAKILKFVNRFKGCGWISTRQVRNWWSAREKPIALEARGFMAEVVSLGYAVDNGEKGAGYQIKITEDGSPSINNAPNPFHEENFSRDYNLVPGSPSIAIRLQL